MSILHDHLKPSCQDVQMEGSPQDKIASPAVHNSLTERCSW